MTPILDHEQDQSQFISDCSALWARKRNYSLNGFTLLEILVVIIIVGVLASVAMPTLFKNVERSRAAEALNALGIMKRALEACAAQDNGALANCQSWAAIGIDDPGLVAGTNFIYDFGAGPNMAFVVGGPGLPDTFTIRATRNANNNGVLGDQVILSSDGTRSGTTAFAGMHN